MKKVHANSNRRRAAMAVVLMVLVAGNVSAQTSLFQDSKGESAYKVLGSVVSVNPADGNISANADIAYSRVKGPDSGTKFRRMGFFGQISANEGVVNLKDASGFPVDGQVGFYYAFVKTSDIMDPEPWVRTLYLSGNAMLDRTQTYTTTGSVVEGLVSKVYTGWKLEAAYNGFRGNLLWGAALNGGQKTNIDYLSAQTIAIMQPVSGPAIGVWDEYRAYSSSEFAGHLAYLNGNVDFAYLVNRKSVIRPGRQLPPIYVAACLRYTCMENEMPVFNPALGVYLSRVGSPQDVVLGLSAQLQDAFDVYETSMTAWQRTTLNLTVGYKFAQ